MVVPGQIMNLKGFKLQLPVAGPKAGSVEEILQPQLDSYSSIYFNASADNGVLFWCPENGAHTSGSTLPRSELREVLDFDLRAGGFHELNVTLAVILIPSSHLPPQFTWNRRNILTASTSSIILLYLR